MNVLEDVLTYMRRLLKTFSNSQLTDQLLIDYVNRFCTIDLPARITSFDLKRLYTFYTQPYVDMYNMPLYSLQTPTLSNSQAISYYPVYQGFSDPIYINGVESPYFNSPLQFYRVWSNQALNQPNIAYGDGGTTYTIRIGQQPLLRGHVDITGVIQAANAINAVTPQDPILGTTFNTNVPVSSVTPRVTISTQKANGENMIVSDSGQFLSTDVNRGLLMSVGANPYGNASLGTYGLTQNVVDYNNATIYVTFPQAVPQGVPINVTCYYYQPGMPRGLMFFNNCITLRTPPNIQYKVEMTAYLTPAAYLTTTDAIEFAYMSEYIARGATRKIMSDTGDIEQFNFYEPLFKEQELLVWKRSQRIVTAVKTPSIFSIQTGSSINQSYQGYN